MTFEKCPIVDNLTSFLTLTAQTFSGAIWAKIPKGVVRAKIPGSKKKTRSWKRREKQSLNNMSFLADLTIPKFTTTHYTLRVEILYGCPFDKIPFWVRIDTNSRFFQTDTLTVFSFLFPCVLLSCYVASFKC